MVGGCVMCGVCVGVCVYDRSVSGSHLKVKEFSEVYDDNTVDMIGEER